MNSELYRQDLEYIKNCEWIAWQKLTGKTILITGATGVIGSMLTKSLLYVSHDRQLDLKIVILVRDLLKAKEIFENYNQDNIKYIVGDIKDVDNLISEELTIDYIVHGASSTSSRMFVDKPTEVIDTIYSGTRAILECARRHQVDGVVFLSTMEVYGTPQKGCRVTEKYNGAFDSMVVRNCYPLCKQLAENMCASYASEFGVPTTILRLTQTFGLGVKYDDGRVFAEFARCAIEKRNIILKTMGKTERSYLYTADAVTAILVALLEGKRGQAYTAANEDTYCSIYEMATSIAEKYKIDVEVKCEDTEKLGYAKELFMNLDTSKLRELGWHPGYALLEMYDRMICDMRENK